MASQTQMCQDQWTPDFCLACDRQTDDGNVYCSENCRLAEYEKSSSRTCSSPSSPTSSRPVSNGFYLEPAYNFSNAQPYGSTPSRGSSSTSKAVLTPSSSQSSLFSMQSNTSTSSSAAADSTQLSEESKKALRAYASAFDHSRYSRRQSGNSS